MMLTDVQGSGLGDASGFGAERVDTSDGVYIGDSLSQWPSADDSSSSGPMTTTTTRTTSIDDTYEAVPQNVTTDL